MAAHNFAPFRTLDRECVALFVGGTGAGAADLTAVKGRGLKLTGSDQFDQTGTGLYTINLSDKWNSLMWFSGTVIDATAPDDWEVCVVAESVATNKTISIAVFKGGALTDLTSDEKLRCFIVMSNTAQSPTAR